MNKGKNDTDAKTLSPTQTSKIDSIVLRLMSLYLNKVIYYLWTTTTTVCLFQIH